MRNTLFYGDNLEVLRDHIGDATVDLVYLDPPFNSNRAGRNLWAESVPQGKHDCTFYATITPMAVSPLRFALVGCGAIAPAHAGSLAGLPPGEAELVPTASKSARPGEVVSQ
jgi:hypothetical protein